MVVGVVEMNSDMKMDIRDRVYSGLLAGKGSFLLLRHYNTFAFTEEGKEQTKGIIQMRSSVCMILSCLI